MIERMTANLTDYIVKNGGDSENQEICQYSISSFFSSLLTYMTILIIAEVFNLFPAHY